MASIINAATSGGLITTADTSGILQLQTAGTTAVTVDASQRAAFVAGTAALPAITTTGDTNTGIFFPAADTIAFAEGGAEAMRIDSAGNVGIGTSTPTARLSVSGNQSFPEKTSAYIGVDAATSSGNGGDFTVKAGTGSGVSNTAGKLFLASGRGNSSSSNGYIAFGVSQSTNAVGLDNEYARIDTSGNLLVGTTSSAAKLHVLANAAVVDPVTISNSDSGSGSQYAIVFRRNTSTIVGSIQTTNTLTSYNTSSDYRLKNSVAPMTGALAKVALLKPSTYKWNVDGSDGEGFIAHELAEVMPQAVSGEKDGIETYTDEDGNEATRPVYQGIDVSFLVATLTAAIQEQQALITQLQADVAALKGAQA